MSDVGNVPPTSEITHPTSENTEGSYFSKNTGHFFDFSLKYPAKYLALYCVTRSIGHWADY